MGLRCGSSNHFGVFFMSCFIKSWMSGLLEFLSTIIISIMILERYRFLFLTSLDNMGKILLITLNSLLPIAQIAWKHSVLSGEFGSSIMFLKNGKISCFWGVVSTSCDMRSIKAPKATDWYCSSGDFNCKTIFFLIE